MELLAFPSTEAEFGPVLLRGVSCSAEMAGGLWLRRLRSQDRLLPAVEAGGLRVRRLWSPGLGNCGDDLGTEQEAVRLVVPGDLRGDGVEAGDFGCRVAAEARARQLSDGVVLAAEDPQCHRAAQSRAAVWRGRDRRELSSAVRSRENRAGAPKRKRSLPAPWKSAAKAAAGFGLVWSAVFRPAR